MANGKSTDVIDIKLGLEADTKDFEKQITGAMSKTGKVIEKQFAGELQKAQEHMRNFIELQKQALSGIKIDPAMYKHAEKLSKSAQDFITTYNSMQESANASTKTLSAEYTAIINKIKEYSNAIEEVKAMQKEDMQLINLKGEMDAYKRTYDEIAEASKSFGKREAELRSEIEETNRYIKIRAAYIEANNDKYYDWVNNTPYQDLWKDPHELIDPKKDERLTELENRRNSYVQEIKDMREAVATMEDARQKYNAIISQLQGMGITTFKELDAEILQNVIDLQGEEKLLESLKEGLADLQKQKESGKGKFELRGVTTESVKNTMKAAANMNVFAESADKADKNVKKTEHTTKKLEQSTNRVSTGANRLLSVIKRIFTTHRKGHRQTHGFLEDTRKGLRHALRNIMRYGIGVRSLYFLFRRLRNATKEAFKIMAQEIPEVNKQVSSLVTNFNLIKANLATMVQPLLRWVVPAFERLAKVAQSAMEWVGKLFATITGQGYIYKASAAWVDYADSVGEAAKQLDNLQKFDELNVIQAPKDGGAFSTDTIDYEKYAIEPGEFEWVKEIISIVSPFNKAVKDLWDNGLSKVADFFKTTGKDFYDEFLKPLMTWAFGNEDEGITGFVTDLNDALQNIDWDTWTTNLKEFYTAIEPYAEAIGQGLLNFLEDCGKLAVDVLEKLFGENGILKSLVSILNDGDPERVESLTTALLKLTVFFSIFKKVGSVVIKGVNGIKKAVAALKGIWLGIQTVMSGILAIPTGNVIEFENSFSLFSIWLEEAIPGWKAIKEEIASVFDTIFEPIFDAWDSLWENLGKIPSNIASFWKDGIQRIIEGWNTWSISPDDFFDFVSHFFTGLGEMFTGLTEMLLAPIEGVVQSIIDWVKDLFGIASPSKEFEEIGQYVVEGFLNPFDDLAEKFGKIWEGVKSAVKVPINGMIDLLNKFLSACQTMQNAIADTFNSVSFDVPDWVPVIGGNHLGFNISKWTAPQIPKLAQGAVIPPNKSFLAMLGDQKSGTNVEAPLSTIEDAVRNVLSEMDFTFNFDVSGDPNKIFTVVQKESDKYRKRTGTPAFT